jgi:tetratricopeptide (TPR) repeat protein
MASNLTLQRRSQRAAEESAAFGPIAERFRRAGDLDRAVSLCREGLQKFPHHISARVTLGWSLLDLGKYEEARVELEQVLRRAPDNLAAIRGLAELHDRAEHTMNLPMDGPGQWPPTEESLAEATPEAFDPEIVRDSPPADPTDIDALQAAVRFAEADEETPQFDVQIRPDAPAVFTSSSGAALKTEPAPSVAEAPAKAEPVAHSEPVAHAEPVVEKMAEPVARTAAYAAAVEEPIAEEPVAEEPVAAEPDLVSESDIAALLAEAERLEAAAAETESVATETMEVAGEIDLDASEDIVFGAAEAVAEPVAEEVAEPMAEAVAEPIAEPVAEEVEEPVAAVAAVAAEAVAEPIAEEFEEPVAEVTAEAVAESVAESVAQPVAEEVAEPVAEIVAEAVADPVAEETAEPIAAAVAEPVAEEVAEPIAEVTAEPIAEAAAQAVAQSVAEVVAEPTAAAEPEVEVATDPVVEAAVSAVVEFDSRSRMQFDDTPGEFGLSDAIVAAAVQSSVAHMHLAEIVPMARAARSDPHAPTLVKLERFLAQVQARRRELMRQSVA